MNLKTAKPIIGLILLLATAPVLAADSADFSSQADAYLMKLASREQFSGAVLVATNGAVILAKGYGLANREHGILNTTNTIFRLASVTKQFTAPIGPHEPPPQAVTLSVRCVLW